MGRPLGADRICLPVRVQRNGSTTLRAGHDAGFGRRSEQSGGRLDPTPRSAEEALSPANPGTGGIPRIAAVAPSSNGTRPRHTTAQFNARIRQRLPIQGSMLAVIQASSRLCTVWLVSSPRRTNSKLFTLSFRCIFISDDSRIFGGIEQFGEPTLRANIDETVPPVIISEQGENRNQCEEQRYFLGFSHGFACR